MGAEVAEGVAGGGGEEDTDGLGGAGALGAVLLDVLEQFIGGAADGALGFEDAVEQFLGGAGGGFRRQGGSDVFEAVDQFSGLGVDEVEFLFDAQGGKVVGDEWFHGEWAFRGEGVGWSGGCGYLGPLCL